MYKVKIADLELTEEVICVDFFSEMTAINAVSPKIVAVITITGQISFDSSKRFMKESAKAIARWSLLSPGNDNVYKRISVELTGTGEIRYNLANAFVISYHKQFEDQNGFFKLVVKEVSPVDTETPPANGNSRDQEQQDQIDEKNKWDNFFAAEKNKRKGNYGEMCTDIDVEAKGPIDPNTKKPKIPPVITKRVGTSRVVKIDTTIRKGIDAIYQCDPSPPEFIVVESKYGSSQLGMTKGGVKQMSDPWIYGKGRISKYFGVTINSKRTDANRIAMRQFLKAFKAGRVQKELSRIDADGNVSRIII